MRAIGKHWYNNGEKEGFLVECPEGWTRGRLPVSEETRRKHRENNGMHKLTEEQKAARSEKLKAAQVSMSEEKKLQRSKNISEARKGKGLGQTPWNKGKKGVQVAWNKGTTMSENQKQLLRDAWNNLSEEEKELRKEKLRKPRKKKEV